MASHRLIVFTEPTPGREDEYNEWYDRVHLGEVLEVEGFVAAERFRLSEAQIGATGEQVPGRYLAIYEIEAPSAEEALANLNAGSEAMDISDALDTENALAIAYSSIGKKQFKA